MSFLEDLYYGKICPSERSLPSDPKYAEYSKQISELMHILKEKLPLELIHTEELHLGY